MGLRVIKFRLMVIDRETRTIEELMPKFDRWVDEFAWSHRDSNDDLSLRVDHGADAQAVSIFEDRACDS